MDNERFKISCKIAREFVHNGNSIGTYREKTLHAILKHYFEPISDCHEVKIDTFIADIFTGKDIIEIQTRNFDKLRRKLNVFLENYPVTVVYPLPATKWLIWIDNSTGEITKKRKSPKTGSLYDAFPELYKIKPILTNPNFKLHIIMIDMDEYRNLDGWSVDKKKGSSRYERIPHEIVNELVINNISDYRQLIPGLLPDNFTVRHFSQASGITQRKAQVAVNVLYSIGAIERIGKQGNAFIYKKAL